MKQQAFERKNEFKTEFGGSLLKKSNPKSARPLVTKKPMHFVLKSSKAKNEYSMRAPRNMKAIRLIIEEEAKKCGVAIHQFANVGNHLHLLIRIKRRESYKRFIRSVTARISQQVTRATKGEPSPIGRFWDYRPYTKVVEWGRHYSIAHDYVVLNRLEGLGLISRAKTEERRLTQFSRIHIYVDYELLDELENKNSVRRSG